MFTLKVENAKGDSFELTHKEDTYQVISIGGLNPPPAQINSASVAGMDGSRFSSSKLTSRNIVLLIKINNNIEENRQYLYKYFRTAQYCKIYYKNNTRDVYCEGYVETIENDLFENGQSMQISIVCHDPYLKAVDEIVNDISQVIALFSFPFSFGANGVSGSTITDDAIPFSMIEKNRIVDLINEGEEPIGVIIEIAALGNVENVTIYNNETREFFKVGCTLSRGDVITINTNSGEKSVMYTHNGVTTSYLRYVQAGSTWFKLPSGGTQFTYSADEGEVNMRVVFKYRMKYEAV